MRTPVKTFGIGLPRCGGQTLQHALHILLGSCVHSPGHHPGIMDEHPASVEVFLDPQTLVDRYGRDIALIMNTRDAASWLRSCQSVYHLGGNWNHPIWRHPLDDFMAYRAQYIGRRESLREEGPRTLWIDLIADPGWSPLCDFLGVPIPNVPFPRVDRLHRSKKIRP